MTIEIFLLIIGVQVVLTFVAVTILKINKSSQEVRDELNKEIHLDDMEEEMRLDEEEEILQQYLDESAYMYGKSKK